MLLFQYILGALNVQPYIIRKKVSLLCQSTTLVMITHHWFIYMYIYVDGAPCRFFCFHLTFSLVVSNAVYCSFCVQIKKKDRKQKQKQKYWSMPVQRGGSGGGFGIRWPSSGLFVPKTNNSLASKLSQDSDRIQTGFRGQAQVCSCPVKQFSSTQVTATAVILLGYPSKKYRLFRKISCYKILYYFLSRSWK